MQLFQSAAIDGKSAYLSPVLFSPCRLRPWFFDINLQRLEKNESRLSVTVENSILPEAQPSVLLADRRLCPGLQGVCVKSEGIFFHSSASD